MVDDVKRLYLSFKYNKISYSMIIEVGLLNLLTHLHKYLGVLFPHEPEDVLMPLFIKLFIVFNLVFIILFVIRI